MSFVQTDEKDCRVPHLIVTSLIVKQAVSLLSFIE